MRLIWLITFVATLASNEPSFAQKLVAPKCRRS